MSAKASIKQSGIFNEKEFLALELMTEEELKELAGIGGNSNDCNTDNHHNTNLFSRLSDD